MSLLLTVLVSMACCPKDKEVGVMTCGTNSTDCQRYSLNHDIDTNCGYKSDKVITTPFGIETSEIPWHAGVYKKESRGMRMICTGTLISKRVVITAAVSYYRKTSLLPVASDYIVAVGNIDHNMQKMEDFDSQKSDVDRLIFHPEYTGMSTKYRNNLALVVAAKEFSYTDNVRPACLNFDPKFDAEMLREADDKKVDLLTWDTCMRALSMKYISIDTCKSRIHGGEDVYMNEDVFCVETSGQPKRCAAGSGAGLMFPAQVGDTRRYFLRGVSTELSTNGYNKALFTNLLPHENFIKSVLDFKESPVLKHDIVNRVVNVTVEMK